MSITGSRVEMPPSGTRTVAKRARLRIEGVCIYALTRSPRRRILNRVAPERAATPAASAAHSNGHELGCDLHLFNLDTPAAGSVLHIVRPLD